MHIAVLHDTHRQPPGSSVCHLYCHINQEKKLAAMVSSDKINFFIVIIVLFVTLIALQ